MKILMEIKKYWNNENINENNESGQNGWKWLNVDVCENGKKIMKVDEYIRDATWISDTIFFVTCETVAN